MEAPEVQYAQNGAVHLAYQVVGRGPPDLVFVPGSMNNTDQQWLFPQFQTFAQRISAFARLILYDKRGQGSSDPAPEVATLEEDMADLFAILDAVGSERPFLFGISEGAPMCLLTAATHPERVSGVALFGGYAHGGPITLMADRVVEVWGSGGSLELIAPSIATPEVMSAFARFERSVGSPAAVVSRVETAKATDVRSILGSVAAPTVVMHCDDHLVPIECGREIAELVPGARFVETPGIDHIPWLDGLDHVTSELEELVTGERQIPPSERALLTILFTDIVGSTERAAALGDERWRQLLDAHDQVTRERVAAYGGRVVKSTGDGFLATFGGPATALRCADSISRRLREVGLELRTGVHTGECEIRDEDIGGIAVHIGARVGAMAGAGEVLATRTVKDLVVGSGISFEDRGTHQLKGIPDSWQIYAASS